MEAIATRNKTLLVAARNHDSCTFYCDHWDMFFLVTPVSLQYNILSKIITSPPTCTHYTIYIYRSRLPQNISPHTHEVLSGPYPRSEPNKGVAFPLQRKMPPGPSKHLGVEIPDSSGLGRNQPGPDGWMVLFVLRHGSGSFRSPTQPLVARTHTHAPRNRL